MSDKMTAISMRRHNAGVRAKRAYGSSTATLFLCGRQGEESVWVEAYGPTPGDRKTNAMRRVENATTEELEGNSELRPLKAYPVVK